MRGIKVTEAVQFFERELGRIELAEIHPGWMLFGDGFHFSQLRNIAKRVFDITICLVLLALAWPLMLLAVVAIVLETGRPVIYKQTRVGLNGKSFSIYKFRSMTQDAEKDGKARWAQANDSRVTRVGAFIRNTRIDELPQIFNVLRGDMSFVGPRPERPEFVEELKQDLPYYDARHRVKPGLMGWAQLNYPYGASREDAAEKLVYDLYYVKNYSLMLDILIVVQTVEIVLLGKGVR
jgi:sugar transferase (PEP-CTERM system associated)